MKHRTAVTMFVTLTLAAACSLTALSVYAAEVNDEHIGSAITHRNCATPDATPAQMTAVIQAVESFRKSHPFETMAVGGQIKVAWHVIYSGTTGNVPQSQIDAQIAYMNQSFGGAFGGVNTGYTFVLASVDRTNNSTWFTMTPGSAKERKAKQALATDAPNPMVARIVIGLFEFKPATPAEGGAIDKHHILRARLKCVDLQALKILRVRFNRINLKRGLGGGRRDADHADVGTNINQGSPRNLKYGVQKIRSSAVKRPKTDITRPNHPIVDWCRESPISSSKCGATDSDCMRKDTE